MLPLSVPPSLPPSLPPCRLSASRAELQELLQTTMQTVEQQYLRRDVRIRLLQTLYDFVAPMHWEEAWDPVLVARSPGFLINCAALAAEWRGRPEDLPDPHHGNAFCTPAARGVPAEGTPAAPANFAHPLNLYACGTTRLSKRLARFDESMVTAWSLSTVVLPPVIERLTRLLSPLMGPMQDWGQRYRDLMLWCAGPPCGRRMTKWASAARGYNEVGRSLVADLLGAGRDPHGLLDPACSSGSPAAPRRTAWEPGRSDGECLEEALGKRVAALEARVSDWLAEVEGLLPAVQWEFASSRNRLALGRGQAGDFCIHSSSCETIVADAQARVQKYMEHARWGGRLSPCGRTEGL
jgi:hypothetical protein